MSTQSPAPCRQRGMFLVCTDFLRTKTPLRLRPQTVFCSSLPSFPATLLRHLPQGLTLHARILWALEALVGLVVLVLVPVQSLHLPSNKMETAKVLKDLKSKDHVTRVRSKQLRAPQGGNNPPQLDKRKISSTKTFPLGSFPAELNIWNGINPRIAFPPASCGFRFITNSISCNAFASSSSSSDAAMAG